MKKFFFFIPLTCLSRVLISQKIYYKGSLVAEIETDGNVYIQGSNMGEFETNRADLNVGTSR